MGIKKVYSLNAILEEIYKAKENIDKIEEFRIDMYKNFKDEKTKDLKKICKSLGINLTDFRAGNGSYEIPLIVKIIIEEYLSTNSSKGGMISKLRSGNIEDISSKEKREFVERLKVRVELGTQYSDEEKLTIKAIINEFMYNITYLAFIKGRHNIIRNHAIEALDNNIKYLINKNPVDGLIRFNKDGEPKEHIKECKESIKRRIRFTGDSIINRPQFNVRDIFWDTDIDVLLDVYERIIDQTSERWKQIVEQFETTKTDYILNQKNIRNSSKEILKQVLEQLEETELIENEDDIENKLNENLIEEIILSKP